MLRGTVRAMQTWMWLLVGLVAGAGGAYGLTRLVFVARSVAVTVERDLLRERVLDLETSLGEDLETAALLAPLKDALRRVEGQVATLERDRVQQFGSLRAVMARVEDETQSLARETASLAGSLRSSSVRGAWGEVQLRRVLEASGMLARCDLDEQVQAVGMHERLVRPDVVVRLPGDKVLVIDAKAPMSAFLQTQVEDLDPTEAVRLLADHARALKSHVIALASKDYWSAFDNTPEAVICFVPSDAVLASALAADPSLYDAALAKRVVLVGPGSLLALLRAVAFTWQQDSVAGSARELLVAARALYGRLGTMGGHVAMMGRSLQRSVETYNQFVGTLETRVLPSARRMHELGVGDAPLATFAPIEQGPRILTAAELLDAVAAADARPELLLTEPRKSPGAATG